MFEKEIFALNTFKKNLDNLTQKLIKYLNEYNKIVSGIEIDKLDIINLKTQIEIVTFFKNMIEDNDFMETFNKIHSIFEKYKRGNNND